MMLSISESTLTRPLGVRHGAKSLSIAPSVQCNFRRRSNAFMSSGATEPPEQRLQFLSVPFSLPAISGPHLLASRLLSGHSSSPSSKSWQMAALARAGPVGSRCSSQSAWNCCLPQVTVMVSRFGFSTSNLSCVPSPLSKHVRVQFAPPSSHERWDSKYHVLGSWPTGRCPAFWPAPTAASVSSSSSSPNPSVLLSPSSSRPPRVSLRTGAKTASGHSSRPSLNIWEIAALARAGPGASSCSSHTC
mmetsp:Transcript_46364/g.107078  ORF Transcript_46364/g.107078 Transcript_46364/m.107078 type:complete len:246 (-) Transcript_46364:325-1062(-)